MFGDWITQKYLEWRGDGIGRAKSVSAFADYLGVSQPLLTRWMNGDYNPNKENANKIAFRLGYEVYDVLEIPEDDRPIRYDLRRAIQSVPPENQDELLQLIDKYLRDHGWTRE